VTAAYYVDDVEQTDTIVRIKGPHQGLTSAADGSYATSNVQILDPNGSLSYSQLKIFRVDETDCAWPRCYTGRIFNLKVTRGPYLTGVGRQYDFEVDDLNGLLHMSILHASSANRPAESGSDRLDWLMSTIGMSGVVFDNGKVMANAWEYPATDYRGKYADDVLADIVSAASAGRWVFFVYWDPTAASGEEVSLFYGEATTTLMTSSLRLSNIPADCDDIDDPLAVTYPVHFDPELNQAGSPIYCGVYVDSRFGKIYHHRQSTHDLYFSDDLIHRDYNFTSDRINSAATAALYAERFLDTHAGQIDTITCTTKLPAAVVNLINSGMRIEAEFEHFPGYETFSFTRIASRTLLPFDGTNVYYDIKLELSVRGVSQTGGGNPGDFPHQPPGPVSVVQSAIFANSGGTAGIVMDQDVGAGNLLVAVVGWRAATFVPSTPTGFTQVDFATASPASGFSSDTVEMSYRIAQAGDGDTFSCPTSLSLGNVIIITEYAGTWPTNPVDVSGVGTGSGVAPTVGLTPTAGGNGVVASGAINLNNNTPSDHDYLAGAGYTLEQQSSDLFGNAVTGMVDKLVPIAAGSYSPNLTCTSGFPGDGSLSSWATVGAFFAQEAATANPPSPGQWVGISPPEIVTMSGADGTTQFAFADGSLVVLQDGFDQSIHIASYDGAAGTFTLDYTPDIGSTITVRYQGR
jgi:hypothetical protein